MIIHLLSQSHVSLKLNENKRGMVSREIFILDSIFLDHHNHYYTNHYIMMTCIMGPTIIMT